MRTSTDILWKLINSMTSSEKLYFRRNYSAPHSASKSNYLKLFNALAAQKIYDEPSLLKKLAPVITKKKPASPKTLSP